LHSNFSGRPAPAHSHALTHFILLMTLLALTGCAQPSAVIAPMPVTETAAPEPLATATAPPLATPTLQPTATPDVELSLWVSPLVPAEMSAGLGLPAEMARVGRKEEATLWLDLAGSRTVESAGEGAYILALAAPFQTVSDGVSAASLKRAWRGQPPRDFAGAPLLMDEDTLALLTAWWGAPAPNSTRVVDAEKLLDQAWQTAPAWAILPFEKIEPRWKVLRVDGISPLERAFDPADYALAVPFRLTGEAGAIRALREQAGGDIPIRGNRDPAKLTVLAMTGVTALARGTAQTMEREGITYPGRDIGPWLAGADLTHISNEVSFADDCPPGRPDARFCSPTRYIGLLESVGTDIVELTGNHNLDWGPEAYLHTLKLYQERGWKVYGGGETPAAARRPLRVEHNGNRLAFLGCNAAGPVGAWAGPYQPGAAACDFDALEDEIRQLAGEGYLPVVTLQHVETDGYQPAVAQNMPDFRRLAQAGAVIVSGSQSHYPQTMTFVGQNFVHYGLGNLFFDQTEPLATRQAFIDRHVFYDGRYLGVELLTTLLEDAARPRLMTTEERAELLQTIFDLCIWVNN